MAAYYEPESDKTHFLKLSELIAEHKTSSEIIDRLQDYLNESLRVLNSWAPNDFLVKGISVENFRRKFDLRQ